jgi:hypothetical protein
MMRMTLLSLARVVLLASVLLLVTPGRADRPEGRS